MSTATLTLEKARKILTDVIEEANNGKRITPEMALDAKAATTEILKKHPEALQRFVDDVRDRSGPSSVLKHMIAAVTEANLYYLNREALISSLYMNIVAADDTGVIGKSIKDNIRKLTTQLIQFAPTTVAALADRYARPYARQPILKVMADGVNDLKVEDMSAEALKQAILIHTMAVGNNGSMGNAQKAGLPALTAALLQKSPKDVAGATASASFQDNRGPLLTLMANGVQQAGVDTLSQDGLVAAVDLIVSANRSDPVTSKNHKKSIRELIAAQLATDPAAALESASKIATRGHYLSDLVAEVAKGAGAVAPETLNRDGLDALFALNKPKPAESTLKPAFDHLMKTPEGRQHMAEVISKLENDPAIANGFIGAAIYAVKHAEVTVKEKHAMLARIADHPRGTHTRMAYVLNGEGMEGVKEALLADKPTVRQSYIQRVEHSLLNDGPSNQDIKDLQKIVAMKKNDDVALVIANAAEAAGGKGVKAKQAIQVLGALSQADELVVSDTGLVAEKLALGMRKRSSRPSALLPGLASFKVFNALSDKLGLGAAVAERIKKSNALVLTDAPMPNAIARQLAGAKLKKKLVPSPQ